MNALWIYKKIDEEPPPELFTPIKKPAEALTIQPDDKMTPKIDGIVTHFYEWHHAGRIDVRSTADSTMKICISDSTWKPSTPPNTSIRLSSTNRRRLNLFWEKARVLNTESTKSVKPQSPCPCFSITEFMLSAHKRDIEIDRTPLLKFMIDLKEVKLYNWSA